MQVDNSNIKDVLDFMKQNESNLCVLEEEIDVETQHKFMTILDIALKDKEAFEYHRKNCIEHINDLFDPEREDDKKQLMLVTLSTSDNIEVFRTIERFSKLDTSVKQWAIIATQQARMLIQNKLQDKPSVFVSSGLGGKGNNIRYFMVLLYYHAEILEKYQENIFENELKNAIKSLHGEIEKLEFHRKYLTVVCLLPLSSDIHTTFKKLVKDCNIYGDFLENHIMITNVKRLDESEIYEIIKSYPNQ